MNDEMHGRESSSQLGRELRSTLAALDELGPAYEHELAAALDRRLHELDGRYATRRHANGGRAAVPALVAALVVAGALLASPMLIAHGSSAHAVRKAYIAHAEPWAAPGQWYAVPAPQAPAAPGYPIVTR